MKTTCLLYTTLLLGLLAAGQTARANSYSGGDGTKNNPYQISTADDWKTFTENVNTGVEADAFYILMNDLTLGSDNEPLTTVVGITGNLPPNNQNYYPFKGCFDGGGHTLTITMSRSELLAAPFGVIDCATICNLTVKGTITSTMKYIAGIAAYAYNVSQASATSYITNCTSSVVIDCQVNGDGSIGGLASQNEKGKLIFTDCTFDGTISGMQNTEKCGGFMNYSGSGTCQVFFENCIMLGVINVTKNIATFCRGNAKKTYTNVYYLNNYGATTSVMKKIETSIPNNTLVRPMTVGNTTYYLPLLIEGIQDKYDYTESAIDVVPTVSFLGKALEKDKDFTFTLEMKNGNKYVEVEEVKNCGNYKITLNCSGDFEGTFTKKVDVVARKTFNIEAQAGNNHYWTTFYSSSAGHWVGEGAQAFTMDSNHKLYRLGTDGRTIPAKTAVIIISDTDSIELTATYNKLTADIHGNKNILTGSNYKVTVSKLKGTPYVMGCVNGEVGFYEFNGSEIPAQKAYYIIQ